MDLNIIALAFLIANVGLILVLPRRLAILPLLLGACYITRAQGIVIGPFNFTCLRILVAVGFIRIIARRERLAGGVNSVDGLMLIWACWVLVSSQFHKAPSGSLVFGLGFGLGLLYDTCGIYFLIRVFCQSLDDLVLLCRFTAIILVPLAIEMLSEKITGHNFFSVFGGVPEITAIREGKLRAQGPFAHAILAGTVGAVCMPFAIALWRQHRKEAVAGIAAGMVMIFASTSSGPI